MTRSGPPGVGKIHHVTGFSVIAIEAGFQGYLSMPQSILNGKNRHIQKRSDGSISEETGQTKVLIIDEIGYLPFDSEAAYCFF
ncbi:MAG: ATP-binding protein [Methanobacteriota archaeon]